MMLELAVDGAPSQSLTLFANVANSMKDGQTYLPTPLHWGEVME